MDWADLVPPHVARSQKTWEIAQALARAKAAGANLSEIFRSNPAIRGKLRYAAEVGRRKPEHRWRKLSPVERWLRDDVSDLVKLRKAMGG